MHVILFQGAFGTVSLVRKKDTGAYYALKMLNKKEVSLNSTLNPCGDSDKKLSTLIQRKIAEQDEAKNAKRSFASKCVKF